MPTIEEVIKFLDDNEISQYYTMSGNSVLLVTDTMRALEMSVNDISEILQRDPFCMFYIKIVEFVQLAQYSGSPIAKKFCAEVLEPAKAMERWRIEMAMDGYQELLLGGEC